MGITLWLVSSAAAVLIARMAPWRRKSRWIGELSVSVPGALAFGVLATALDFGGWKEPDWRAAVFALLGALIAIGVLRLFTRARREPSAAHEPL